MIKTYKKIAPIQAEQFDGSQEMCEAWDIYTIAPGEYVIDLMDDIYTVHLNQWLVAGKGMPEVIDDDIFKATYEEV